MCTTLQFPVVIFSAKEARPVNWTLFETFLNATKDGEI